MGDLTQCADVLVNQLQSKAPNATPWQDLRYIFGEIMYGGHITDKYDRRTNNTYLEVGINEGLLTGKDMVPGFKAILDGDYLSFEEYIKTQLPGETPALYGLHPNAEIGFLTTECNTLFATVMELSSGSGGGGGGKDKVVQDSMLKLLGQCPASFNVFEINLRIQEKHPFVVVLMQEIDRMNTLLDSIRKTLSDLKLGLEGALNISDAMDNLANSLFLNKVPAIWEKDAYPSSRSECAMLLFRCFVAA
jgi:dynein heavy chain